ncbi:MAG TPA: GNAT family N-acetyltransferase [Jatrophihabitans sp.]|nr:GNAT family N-acetyltransferase [Jatrophihabitans sp.]
MQREPSPRELRLRPLAADDEPAVRAAQQVMAAEDFEFALHLTPDTPWTRYLAALARQQAGVGLARDRVPATFLVAEVDGEIVGRVSIRHRLNDRLRANGGHIGFGVLPAYRRRGFATEMLRQGLVVARAVGVDRVLVTCDDDNIASRAVIERCGGRLDPDRPVTPGPVPIRRYWID